MDAESVNYIIKNINNNLNNNNMNLTELQEKVIEWAEDKGLLTDVTEARITAQAHKVLEEIGETAGAFLKGNRDEIIDGVGDILVTLILLSKMREHDEILSKDYRYNFEDCVYPLWYMTEGVIEFLRYNHIQDLIKVVTFLDEFCRQNDIDLIKSLSVAYNVISKRKGRMVGDTFIKD